MSIAPGQHTPGGPAASSDPAASDPPRLGVRRLVGQVGFRRLMFSRLASQWGEGVFQAGLAGAVLFNPERQANPAAIAAGFAVLLLPYSLIGPFAGALLDRWDRRRVLVVANLLRAALVLVTATAVSTGVAGVWLYVTALLVTGVSRFVGSGLSAALPHVVTPRHLVEANAVATTFGSVTAVVGAACAIGLRGLFGTGNHGSAWATSFAVLGCVVSAALAARFAAGALGPDEVDEPSATLLAVALGLLDGGRAAWRTPSVAAGLVAVIAHRLAFGASLLITVLLLRYTFHDVGPLRAGMAGLGEVAVAGGLGILCAGLVTTRIVVRFGRRRTVVFALLLAGVAQLVLGLPMLLPSVLLASFVIVAAGQVVKLCVDSAVQSDVGDETRGRVFALYDTLVNVSQVAAVTAVAMVVPLDGRAPWLVVAAALAYFTGTAGYLLVLNRHPHPHQD